jgi:uncharacterized membrane protein YhaH (DUF805 family)
MGFAAAVRDGLRAYVTFSGRARRPAFWWFALFTTLANIGASLIDAALLGLDPDGGGPVATVVGLLLFLPAVAVTWRRLHDVGRSGWWCLAPQAASVATAFVVLAMSASPEWGTGTTPTAFVVLAALSGLATLAAVVAVFVWLVSPSQPGPNRFGPEPAA